MRYVLTIGFETSETLSFDERRALVVAALAQIEDPAPLDEESRRAGYTTFILGAELVAEDDHVGATSGGK